MSEQRLIDANKLYDAISDNWSAVSVCSLSDILGFISETETIDTETLPIVQQLRKKIKNLNAGIENLSKIIKNAYEKRDEFKEKLESVTAELDSYKIFFNNVTACGDCNDCVNLKTCKYKPSVGEITRFNCPLWSKHTSIPRDQWQDAAEVME